MDWFNSNHLIDSIVTKCHWFLFYFLNIVDNSLKNIYKITILVSCTITNVLLIQIIKNILCALVIILYLG